MSIMCSHIYSNDMLWQYEQLFPSFRRHHVQMTSLTSVLGNVNVNANVNVNVLALDALGSNLHDFVSASLL